MKTVCWSSDAASVGEAAAVATEAGAEPVAFKGGQGSADALAKALKKEVETCRAEAVVIVSNRRGAEVAPYLAALLDWPILARCSRATLDNGAWVVERKYLGGRTVATLKAAAPVVVTVNPHAYEAIEADAKSLQPADSPAKVVEVKKRNKAGASIETADTIVTFGRGIKKKEDMQAIFELAKALGGEVGCTRPIAADLHWLGDDRWIGLSGKNVKPKLYIACGVSGQIQHIAGCRDAGTIVVINQDKSAPFFKLCDYGIVGDLYKVVPALTKTLASP